MNWTEPQAQETSMLGFAIQNLQALSIYTVVCSGVLEYSSGDAVVRYQG